MASALQENDHAIHDEEAKFRQFDVVNDCSDHYFANSKHAAYKKACFTSTGNGALYKKIMQDWRILEKDLPESIYVRVYAGRIDLLRAAIIGARETPYHDGLFFFDFAFPCDYPNRPPLVYYHSHGLRLNPNLYSGGAVCLSLLNTWFGTENEKWNPSVSTVLQVLVSLQGIVLNDKPYYNEPGFKLSGSWETYNEDAFLLSCKTMLFLLQNPPRNFEAFVVGHFCERANSILSACKAYQDGHVRVGLYRDENTPICMSEIQASDRFMKSMDKLYMNTRSNISQSAENDRGFITQENERTRNYDRQQETKTRQYATSEHEVTRSNISSEESTTRNLVDNLSFELRALWNQENTATVQNTTTNSVRDGGNFRANTNAEESNTRDFVSQTAAATQFLDQSEESRNKAELTAAHLSETTQTISSVNDDASESQNVVRSEATEVDDKVTSATTEVQTSWSFLSSSVGSLIQLWSLGLDNSQSNFINLLLHVHLQTDWCDIFSGSSLVNSINPVDRLMRSDYILRMRDIANETLIYNQVTYGPDAQASNAFALGENARKAGNFIKAATFYRTAYQYASIP